MAELAFFLEGSCGEPKLSRRDADDPLEVKRKMALVREAGLARDLRQAEPISSAQEVLRPFNAARDQILVRGQAGGRLELPRKVIGAEMGDSSHLLQRGTACEIFHHVLNDRAEFLMRKYAARRGRLPVPVRDMTDQVS